MRSDDAPIVASAGRRTRSVGRNASRAVARNRRWPPGVTKDGIWFRSAQRRRVLGVTPRVRLAWPRVSQRFWSAGLGATLSFLAKTSQIYHPRDLPRCDPRDAVWSTKAKSDGTRLNT